MGEGSKSRYPNPCWLPKKFPKVTEDFKELGGGGETCVGRQRSLLEPVTLSHCTHNFHTRLRIWNKMKERKQRYSREKSIHTATKAWKRGGDLRTRTEVQIAWKEKERKAEDDRRRRRHRPVSSELRHPSPTISPLLYLCEVSASEKWWWSPLPKKKGMRNWEMDWLTGKESRKPDFMFLGPN